MIEQRAPGKLYIAGEYAVVDPGQPAVIVAVDRYITVQLSEGSQVGRVRSSAYGRSPLVWVRDDASDRIVLEHQPYDYVFAAITAVEQLRSERSLPPRYYDLDISSELDDVSGRKFGLGSSAAVTVAVVAALDEFYGLGLGELERFKLALLATIEVAPTASGGDLAASTFGGWIRYASPDRGALRAHRAAHGVSATLAARQEWAGSGVTRLAHPDALQLLVGWTGSPASTERLVEQVRTSESRTPLQPYPTFIADSRACVDALVDAFARGGAGAPEVLGRARRVLQRLGASSGITIETPQLRDLCDIAERHGAGGKPSGAGGGDCGIVLADADLATEPILREWEANDIRRLSLAPHPASGGVDAF
ncbi:phosphomevalonate kinase [Leucobacter chromiiresistens]|uniref:phosphomevalonate kinase n=1 Tax=Leucobacter chromiiresistens TaxID=1079994 RepID=A0A1H0Y0N8_9MICO|nr:phosphomevalonate kinase [Leucobacter chromiiresistens]SDQ08714.1 phosphomevalonate kinase [Leucobacter chromiiresistens]